MNRFACSARSLSLCASIALAFSASPTFAGNATPDPTFNGNGLMARELTTVVKKDYSFACAVQWDGKLLMSGSSFQDVYGYNRDFAEIRHNPDGTPDFTFGDGTGKVITSFNSGVDQAQAMVSLPNGWGGGSVLAGNTQANGLYYLALTKYTSAGLLDTSFGGTGKVVTPFGGADFNPTAIALQWDAKYVVAGGVGTTSSTGGLNLLVTRYKNDGTLDTSFGSSGSTVITVSSTSNESARAVAIQNDNKIVVVGTDSTGVIVARLTAQGALDTTFGTGGKVYFSQSPARITPKAVAIQPDGKIVVGGSIQPSSGNSRAMVLRFTPTGALDTSFNGTGYNSYSYNANIPIYMNAMELLPTGQILLGGRSFISTYSLSQFTTIRFTANGALDTSYSAPDGYRTNAEFSSQNGSEITGLCLLPDGKFYATGSSDSKYAAVRYTGDPLDVTPTAFTFTSLSNVAPSTLQMSEVMTISGVTPGALVPIRVVNGKYSLNGGATTTLMSYVKNGDQVFVTHTSAATAATATTTSLVIGGVHPANNRPNTLGQTVIARFTTTTQ
jgi:uncharacterized delta-60 repeat protein